MLRAAAALALVLIQAECLAGEPCHGQALRQLQKLAPPGYAIYRQVRDKQDFLRWVTCDDVVLGLTTAVHETVHVVTGEIDAYPLIDGGRLPRVPEGGFLAPGRLAGRFDASSTFVATYLKPGAASSASELRYLLDELNAYSHDLHAAVPLQAIADPSRDVYHRDGLAALMAFTAAYVEEVRARHLPTWSELQKPETRPTVVRLWEQAERVMASSCGRPRLGLEAPHFLASVCAMPARGGLAQLLGRPPACHRACLEEARAEGGQAGRSRN